MRFPHIALLTFVLATLTSSCGGSKPATTPPTVKTTTAAESGRASSNATIRVGLVTDAASNEPTLTALATSGLRRAQQQLGIEGRVLVSTSRATSVAHMKRLAEQGYDLVIAVGPPLADAVASVATQFPKVSFAIVDVSQATLAGRPANARGLLFEVQQGGYLAGYLAALVNAGSFDTKHVIASVGGRKTPSVDKYIAGFRAGAKKANPGVTTLNAYAKTFVDQAKCKEVALDQISRGADVIFPVAGRCGLGALAAAKERNVRAIGVDADQADLGPYILTSALKGADVAVFQTIRAAQDGSFTGGGDVVYDIRSGGVGLGRIADDIPSEIVAKVRRVQEEIAAGELTDIPEQVR